jgi:hypothetical protein
MTHIDTIVKEQNGSRMEARITKSEHAPYMIDYFINGRYIQSESFPGYSLHFVENAAENWINGIKVLNG